MSGEFIPDAVAATAAAADQAPVRKEFDPDAYVPVKAAELSALLKSLTVQARLVEKIAEHLGIDV
jgi:hypothetical protein